LYLDQQYINGKESFHLCLYITISSSTPSNISQDDADVLEKKQQEMQQRHKEQQQLLIQLKEVAKLYQIKHVAQKARKEAEAKAREEAKRKRVAGKKKKKKRTLKYLQQLQDKILKEEATLLEGTEESQITGPKCKEAPLGDNTDCWPSKKAKGKQPVRY